jgi:hypothetical protein
MLIAYLTTDEVNQDLALQLAAGCDAVLCPLSPGDMPWNGLFDAMIYDPDYLPPARWREVLAELLAEPSPGPVAVHGYNLDEREARALRQHGVLVHRRLEPELFRALRQMAGRSRPVTRERLGGCMAAAALKGERIAPAATRPAVCPVCSREVRTSAA